MAEMDVRDIKRWGSSKKAERDDGPIQLADLRQVTVLPKVKWLKIQEELNNVNKDEERIREAAKQRKLLQQQSKDMVKQWSNTLAGQRQKRLEAKKIREELEEEERKLIDIEEAKYQAEKRKEAIGKARTQLYYQTDRVRGLHSALLLTEVLKEREAQIELKRKKRNSSKDVDKQFVDAMRSRDGEASKREEERQEKKKKESAAVTEELKRQMKEKELQREREKLEDKIEGEETQQMLEIYLQQLRTDEEQQVEQRRNLMRDHLEHLASREATRAAQKQKERQEEEQRKLFLAGKQRMLKLKKDKESEMLREERAVRERIADKLAARQQTQTSNEEERIARAVAQRDAKEAREQAEKEEKRVAELRAIAAHREAVIQEKRERESVSQQREQELAQARKEADRIFAEKQKLKSEKMRQDSKASQDFCVTQMAERLARNQQLRKEERQLKVKNEDLLVEEEADFQQYSHQVIKAAADAQRNIYPLCKAAREGIGGGLGPIFGGLRPSYMVQDDSGAQMPSYISGTTQNIKELHDTTDIQKAKRRLGFTW